MRQISIEEASRLLIEKDPYKYKKILEVLSRTEPNVITVLTSEQKNILVQCEIALGVRQHITKELHVASGPADIERLIRYIPEGESYAFFYDEEACNEIMGYINGKKDTDRRLLFMESRSQLIIQNNWDVISLDSEYDGFIEVCEDINVKKYWNLCKMFSHDTFKSWGIVRDNKMLAFCCISPCVNACYGVPTREICWIYTDEKFRGQGMGKAVLSMASQFILEHGLAVYYSVVSDNLASYHTAKSVGLKDCGLQSAYILNK